MNQLMDDGGDCRKAPATPSIIIIFHLLLSMWGLCCFNFREGIFSEDFTIFTDLALWAGSV